jgi:uncharacterized protein YdcH (DUF465 family)
MKKLKETLWKNYKEASEKIESLSADDPHYEMLLEERDKVRNKLFQLEQACMETDVKKGQIEAENKREKTRNIISIATFTTTTLVGIWTVLKTFKFDQGATVTSTLGRSNITNVVSKMFKR